MEQPGFDEPCYVISVVAKMVGLPPQTLRYYERTGLLEPSRLQREHPALLSAGGGAHPAHQDA